jgi:CheY-like chemotaxis protein
MANSVILCVDDEKIVLDSIKKQLKDYYKTRFSYETAENAEEALELIDEIKAEGVDMIIIVSDWLMPGIKGDDFLIKVHNKYHDIIKILLSGQVDNEALERAKKYANLHKCIYKPWTQEDLIHAIDTSIEKLSIQ